MLLVNVQDVMITLLADLQEMAPPPHSDTHSVNVQFVTVTAFVLYVEKPPPLVGATHPVNVHRVKLTEVEVVEVSS